MARFYHLQLFFVYLNARKGFFFLFFEVFLVAL